MDIESSPSCFVPRAERPGSPESLYFYYLRHGTPPRVVLVDWNRRDAALTRTSPFGSVAGDEPKRVSTEASRKTNESRRRPGRFARDRMESKKSKRSAELSKTRKYQRKRRAPKTKLRASCEKSPPKNSSGVDVSTFAAGLGAIRSRLAAEPFSKYLSHPRFCQAIQAPWLVGKTLFPPTTSPKPGPAKSIEERRFPQKFPASEKFVLSSAGYDRSRREWMDPSFAFRRTSIDSIRLSGGCFLAVGSHISFGSSQTECPRTQGSTSALQRFNVRFSPLRPDRLFASSRSRCSRLGDESA